MSNNIEDHIVICNWHTNGERIVAELHSEQAAPNIKITIITTAEIDEFSLRERPEYQNVYFVRSDPTLHKVLERAGVLHARSVIILSDPDSPDPDAKAALISLAITKCDHNISYKPRIIAEVMNPDKVQHLQDAGVDEWVCSAGFGLGIIAQTALYGKLSEVYQQLLSYSSDTNEIYLLDSLKYPEWFIGKKFHEIAAILNQRRNVTNAVILIGIKRGDEIMLNPSENEFDRLIAEDGLIVIAFDPPDLRTNLPIDITLLNNCNYVDISPIRRFIDG